MKKKVLIGVILICLVIGLFILFNYKKIINKRNQLHYDKIIERIQPDIAAYIRLTSPYCDPSRGEKSGVSIITDETLIYQRGMDKELLLDVDGKSYCKVRIESRCVDVNKHEWDTYLKCKDYEDYEYSHWDETEEQEKLEQIEKVTFNDKEKKIINLINNKLNINNYFVKDKFVSFDIINLQKFGYYESESNLLYMTVYYEAKCTDNTSNCVNLDIYKGNDIDSSKTLSFMIKVDVKDYNYIEKIDGFAAHINSDWKYVSGRIE